MVCKDEDASCRGRLAGGGAVEEEEEAVPCFPSMICSLTISEVATPPSRMIDSFPEKSFRTRKTRRNPTQWMVLF